MGTYLKDLKTQDTYHYAGVRKEPSYTDNGDGSVTIGNDGLYSLYSDASGSSLIEVFTATGGTFTLQDNLTNYIYIKYSSSSPVVLCTTNRQDVVGTNLTNATPIFTLYRYGTLINNIDWQDFGLALSEKMFLRLVNTDRFHRTEGLILGEKSTRYVTVTSGSVYYGVNQISIPEFDSSASSCSMFIITHDASNVWTGKQVTQYDNTYYQSSAGSAVLTNSQRYSVNWVYRIVNNTTKYVFVLLGMGDYKIDEALAAMPPSVVPTILSQGILVGKITVAKGATVATSIDSAFDIGFSPTSLDHNSLFGLQGGTTDEYYHLTANQYTSMTSVVSASANINLLASNNVILCNGTFSTYLPTAVGNIGKTYHIKNIGTGIITVLPSGSQVIDSASALSITSQYSSAQIVTDGLNWYII